MDLISILGKKYVKEILLTLYKHGTMNFGKLKKLTGCPDGTLHKRLNELEDAGLIVTWEEESRYRLPQRMCKLTELGKKAVLLYMLEEVIPELTPKKQSLLINLISSDDNEIGDIQIH